MLRKLFIAIAIASLILLLMPVINTNYLKTSKQDSVAFASPSAVNTPQSTTQEVTSLKEGEWKLLRKNIRDLIFQEQRCVVEALRGEVTQQEKEAKMKACYEPLKAIAQTAIASGDPESLYEIAIDRNLKKNRPISETITLLKSSAEKGNAFSAQHLGQLYYYGLEYPEKYEEVLQKYYEVRQSADPFAETTLIDLGLQGDFYRNGEVKQDIAQALYWFEQSQKHWRSLLTRNYIAELSFLGNGVPRDLVKAQNEIAKDAEVLEKADPTLGEGNNSLYKALINSDLENPQRNTALAIAALEKAVQQQSTLAKIYRAHLSWFGHEVPLDTAKVKELFQDQDWINKKTPLLVALWILSESNRDSEAKQKAEIELTMRVDFESGSDGLEQAYLGIGFGTSLTDSIRSERWLIYARKNGVFVNRNCRSLSIEPGKFPHLGSMANEKTFDGKTSELRCAALLDHLARLSTLRTMIEQDREAFWRSYDYRAHELLNAFAKHEFRKSEYQVLQANYPERHRSENQIVSDPEVEMISRQIEEAIENRMRARQAGAKPESMQTRTYFETGLLILAFVAYGWAIHRLAYNLTISLKDYSNKFTKVFAPESTLIVPAVLSLLLWIAPILLLFYNSNLFIALAAVLVISTYRIGKFRKGL